MTQNSAALQYSPQEHDRFQHRCLHTMPSRSRLAVAAQSGHLSHQWASTRRQNPAGQRPVPATAGCLQGGHREQKTLAQLRPAGKGSRLLRELSSTVAMCLSNVLLMCSPLGGWPHRINLGMTQDTLFIMLFKPGWQAEVKAIEATSREETNAASIQPDQLDHDHVPAPYPTSENTTPPQACFWAETYEQHKDVRSRQQKQLALAAHSLEEARFHPANKHRSWKSAFNAGRLASPAGQVNGKIISRGRLISKATRLRWNKPEAEATSDARGIQEG